MEGWGDLFFVVDEMMATNGKRDFNMLKTISVAKTRPGDTNRDQMQVAGETYAQLIKINSLESTLKVSTCTSPAFAGQGQCKRNMNRTYYNESLLMYIT
ncbi:hypothetical protein GQX74_003560 [Glossina fuscipes]|nr:hypothetical protein GQX74_003560 [Glossina fuscipes]